MVTNSKQKGVVLVVAIVILIALSSAASVLMLNTSTDMKMAGASQEKVIATQEAIGLNSEVIYRQVKQLNGDENGFTYTISMYPSGDGMEVPVTGNNVDARIHRSNDEQIESDCPHSRMASSIQVFKCNMLTVRTVKGYGKKVTADDPEGAQLSDDKYNKVEVTSGVAQQLLNLGN